MDHAVRKLTAICLFVTALAAALAAPLPAAACDDCENPVIDAAEAHARSMREGRDPVEGFWLVYLDWKPEDESLARSYRIAVVRNTYGVYPEADYLGVATCDSPGCKRGEVKLTLKRAFRDGDFEAVFMVSDGVTAKGTAMLTGDDERGRPDSVIDMSGVKYEDKAPTLAIVRIIGG